MPKQYLLLTAAGVLAGIVVIAWMVTPDVPPAKSEAPLTSRPFPAEFAREPSETSTADEDSPVVRWADRQATPSASAAALSTSGSSRFTTTPGDPLSDSPSTPAGPPAHIRVLNVPAPSGSPTASPRAPAGEKRASIVLEVPASMHDPAAWMASEEPMTETQEAVREQLAGHFEAEVAAAVADPTTASRNGLDQAWRDARNRANWNYRKFFGDAAANRAAINAGHAAVAN